jgi:prolyl-tRNA synthetase
MAQDKKMVTQITSMDDNFAQWYTDICKKADLIDYSSVKGCMIIRPYGYAIWEHIQNILDTKFKERDTKTYICRCLYPNLFSKRKRTT